MPPLPPLLAPDHVRFTRRPHHHYTADGSMDPNAHDKGRFRSSSLWSQTLVDGCGGGQSVRVLVQMSSKCKIRHSITNFVVFFNLCLRICCREAGRAWTGRLSGAHTRRRKRAENVLLQPGPQSARRLIDSCPHLLFPNQLSFAIDLFPIKPPSATKRGSDPVHLPVPMRTHIRRRE